MEVAGVTGPIVVGALTTDRPAAGGIQRYTGEILRELLRLDPAVVGLIASEGMAGGDDDARLRRVRPEVMARGSFTGNLLRLAWHQTALPRMLRRMEASAFYSPIPDGMLHPVIPQVVTIHDLIPLRFPSSAPRLHHYFRVVVPRIARASAAVIAMSEATRRDVIRLLGVPGERVHVVHQGYRADLFHPAAAAEVEGVRARYRLGRYLLSVGEGRPYKNIPRLLRAFARVSLPDLQLVLVGRAVPQEVDLPALARALGIAERVRFPGFVADEELAPLYAGAEAFVFPSLYEGFGIPPLEAMACGCPVVCSDRASLPEVCGEAALYVDPEDEQSIAEAIERVVGDEGLRDELRARGLERAKGFSYRRAAERVLEVVRGVAARPLAGNRATPASPRSGGPAAPGASAGLPATADPAARPRPGETGR